jgi:hypothetical protein
MSHTSTISDVQTALKETISLSGWHDSDVSLSPKEKKSNREELNYISALQKDFLSILSDVNNAEDQLFCLSLFFARLKSEWTLINTRYTYQIQNNALDQALLFRAGLLSALLGKVESHLNPELASHLNDVLTDPAGTADKKQQQEQAQASLHVLQQSYQTLQAQLDDIAHDCGALSGTQLLVERRQQQDRIDLLARRCDLARQTEARLLEILDVSTPEEAEDELNRLRDSVTDLTVQLLAKPTPVILPELEASEDLESMLTNLQQALQNL